MAKKKILSLGLATLLALSSICESTPVTSRTLFANAKTNVAESAETEVVVDEEQVDASYGLCDTTKEGAILHAFCWSFNTIKQNMENIAAAGYTTVQTSPINECLVGEGGGMELFGNGKWYYHYQPTDWKIGNYQLGSRDEYKAMCEEAEKYGVKIISDVLPNHTTPSLGAVSDSLANAAGGKTAGNLYHSNGFNEITQWQDRFHCTTGQMGGLPDVNTENQGFQKYYVEFCNDVVACGGDGFRYDTAKHIGVPSDPKDPSNTRGQNDFWDVATGKKEVNGVKFNRPANFFIYGEVLQDAGIPYAEYASYMEMTASGYGYVLRDNNLKNYTLPTGNVTNWCHDTPDMIVTWVESHDTYCNEHNSAWMNDFQIRAGWAIIAARDKGTPLFFSRPAGSNGSQGNIWGNNKIGAAGNDEYKHPEVAAANHFRNAMVGEKETLSNPNGNSSVLVIERGDKGAVVINMGSTTSNVPLTKMADGTYTEEVSGKQVEVSGKVLKCEVPGQSIAVVYNAGPVTKDPVVSVSKDSGSFTAAFDLTLTAKNATSASYETSEGVSGEFTTSKTIKIGETTSVGDKVTVTVKATGESGTEPFEKTFTYNMVDVPEIPDYKLYVRTKKSDYSSAPNAYVYKEGGGDLNGKWPGSAMELSEDGEYYVYATNDADSALIIFSYDGGQDPAAEQPGHKVSGYMEYSKSSKSVTAFTPEKKPSKTTAPKETAKPKETEKPKATEKPKETEEAKATEKPKTTPSANGDETIEVSEEDGSSFNTETLDVKITLNGVSEGTYCVDNGPVKSFTSSATVTLGEGKIADSDVTLKVTAGDKTKTFTYKKVFDVNTAQVKTSAVKKLQSLFEVVADAATVAAGAETGGLYATNPGQKVGKAGTITIDGDASDWSEDMLIAQCGAWDIANNWKGGHENCVLDSYALYASWDDENLYLGWQMVNTTDTWAREGDGPLSDGGRVLDVPLMLALNVGNRTAMTGKMAGGKKIWDALEITFDTRVDNILLMSGKPGLGTPGYFIAADDEGNASYDASYCLSFKTEGIAYKMAETSIPDKIMMLDNSQSPEDVYDADKYIDASTKGHDRKYDSFYEINIPFKTLGIDKSYLETNGIGVMQISTRGISGIDCIPHDPSMLDNVSGDCMMDASTSAEKDDPDNITVPLAAVGNIKAFNGGGGGDDIVITPKPKETEKPVETEKPEETTKPVATAKPKETEKPEETKKPVTTPSAAKDKFSVNFGADRSSPQYNTTTLTLKAVEVNAASACQYKFVVEKDGKETVLSDYSAKDTYEWKGEAGSYNIKVYVKDENGKVITSTKKYVLEKDEKTPEATKVPAATKEPQATKTPEAEKTKEPAATKKPSGEVEKPTAEPTKKPTAEPTKKPTAVREDLNMDTTITYTGELEAGSEITIALDGKGGTAPYTYVVKVIDSKNKVKNLLNSTSSNRVTWQPMKSGTYTVYTQISDSDGDMKVERQNLSIKTPVKVSKFKISKKTGKVKKALKITGKASSIGKVKYKFTVKKSGTKKEVVVRKYSTKGTCTWKPAKAGKYTVYMTVKDSKGNTKKVSIKKVVIKK